MGSDLARSLTRETSPKGDSRETFSSRFTLLATMVGVAVGLGNVWRFPTWWGASGAQPSFSFICSSPSLIGIPALMAEWTLGRHTQRGTVGAFERAGLPGGRVLGWVFFGTVTAATAYYTNAIGWVVFHGLAGALAPLGVPLDGRRFFLRMRDSASGPFSFSSS